MSMLLLTLMTLLPSSYNSKHVLEVIHTAHTGQHNPAYRLSIHQLLICAWSRKICHHIVNSLLIMPQAFTCGIADYQDVDAVPESWSWTRYRPLQEGGAEQSVLTSPQELLLQKVQAPAGKTFYTWAP